MLNLQTVAHPRRTRAEAPAGVDDRTPHGDFVFAHKAGEWMMDVEGDLVPVIVTISRRSGVNGYLADDNAQRDEVSWGRLRAESERKGFIYIDDDALQADGIDTLYAVYPTQRGRLTYRSLVQTPVESGDGGVRWEVDQKAWKLIGRALVASGKIPKPSAGSLRSMLAVQDAKLEVLAQQRPNSGDPRLEKWTRDYTAASTARANIAKMLGEVEVVNASPTSRIRSALARFADDEPSPPPEPAHRPAAPSAEPQVPAAEAVAVEAAQPEIQAPAAEPAPVRERRKPGPKPKPRAEIQATTQSREDVDLGDG